ncbi:MAG: cobalamin-dependent protein, partial [Pseudomonadota bacterium]|nr:cobalamin-dependent protein [Pseudomonadota bacterium]
ASLFDGHDAAINIIRRLLQASGAEVIHLGHNRSVAEIVDAAVQEDVQGIAARGSAASSNGRGRVSSGVTSTEGNLMVE